MAASSKTLSKEQIANLSKREKTTILIAILSLYFVVCSTMTISPALQTLYNAFPDFDRTTVMYIYTLPSLVGIPVTILIGLIAGTKVRYRTILLSATALMVVMGVAPFFIDNLYVILACRFLFGIGQASCLGVEVSLMYMFFSGKETRSLHGLHPGRRLSRQHRVHADRRHSCHDRLAYGLPRISHRHRRLRACAALHEGARIERSREEGTGGRECCWRRFRQEGPHPACFLGVHLPRVLLHPRVPGPYREPLLACERDSASATPPRPAPSLPSPWCSA